MSHQIVKTEIMAIITDKTMQAKEQIENLANMRGEVRAQIRAATESGMVDDDELGDDLMVIDEALKTFGAKADSIDDGGATI